MLVAGVDEAGRGPLFGPVVVAAVILPQSYDLPALTDSKKLSAKKREQLFEQICGVAIAYSIVEVPVEAIDRLNILQASLLGMRESVERLSITPDQVIVDGNAVPESMPVNTQSLVGGDAIEPSISAASILAKVHRDQLIIRMSEDYPEYGLAQHKGYPTKQHLEALRKLGPTPHHRRSFAPVKKAFNAMQSVEVA